MPANVITKLPRAEHEAAEWQAPMEALILVATSGGPADARARQRHAALNRYVERVFNPDRKDTHWGKKAWRSNMRCWSKTMQACAGYHPFRAFAELSRATLKEVECRQEADSSSVPAPECSMETT
jgi:hypothetical protein